MNTTSMKDLAIIPSLKKRFFWDNLAGQRLEQDAEFYLSPVRSAISVKSGKRLLKLRGITLMLYSLAPLDVLLNNGNPTTILEALPCTINQRIYRAAVTLMFSQPTFRYLTASVGTVTTIPENISVLVGRPLTFRYDMTKYHETVLLHLGCLVPFPSGRGTNSSKLPLETSISILVCGVRFRIFSMQSQDAHIPLELATSIQTVTLSPTDKRKRSKNTSRKNGASKQKSRHGENQLSLGLDVTKSVINGLNNLD